jgi:DNA-binding CsgD family transcriptional regulator
MTLLEIVLMIMAYILIIVTIFLQLVCYKRNLETFETIAFTFSLFLLIIALTVSSFLEQISHIKTTDAFILLTMVLVGSTTPLNVVKERQFSIEAVWRKVFISLSVLLFLCTIAAWFFDLLPYMQYAVTLFLGFSVVLSLILVRTTKPHERIMHREKTERIFAVAFMILVPLSLIMNYYYNTSHIELKIGFTIPLVFILLAGSKFLDDWQRLSLLNLQIEPKEQNFKNYSLSEREKKIAMLLVKGKTYDEISEALYISLPTVETYTNNIYRKFGVKSRAGFTAILMR